MFVLPKKSFPTAVLRNTIKRRIRAALTKHHPQYSLLIRVFPTAAHTRTSDFQQIFDVFFGKSNH
jgi:ribonuclease P protein component